MMDKKTIKQALKAAKDNRYRLEQIRDARFDRFKFVMTEDEYYDVMLLLTRPEGWELRAQEIVTEYDMRLKTCMSSSEYAAICTEIEIGIMMLEYIKRLISPQLYEVAFEKLGHSNLVVPRDTEYNLLVSLLTPFAELAQQKTEQDAKDLRQKFDKLHEVAIDINIAFVRHLTAQLKPAYNALKPKPESIFDPKEDGSEYWFNDYQDIGIYLTNSLLITLDSLKPNMYPAKESHGAITGMLTWAEQVKKHIITTYKNRKPLNFDYTQFARELRSKMQYYTLLENDIDIAKGMEVIKGQSAEYAKGKFDKSSNVWIHYARFGHIKLYPPAPLPKAQPVSKKQLIEKASIKHPVLDVDDGFLPTKRIQKRLKALQQSNVFADYEEVVLSAAKVEKLKAVDNRIINELLSFLLLKPCSAEMLNEDLLVHLEDDKYIKILPEMSGKYMSYRFIAVNRYVLLANIKQLERILKGKPEYEGWLCRRNKNMQKMRRKQKRQRKLIRGQNIRGAAQIRSRKGEYKENVFILEKLRDIANIVFRGKPEMGVVSKIIGAQYYKTCFIPQHHLVVWVYNREEYKKTSQTSVDDKGKIVKYEIHHIDHGEFNNRPDNLAVIPDWLHRKLTNKLITVEYKGEDYDNLKDYCRDTNAGNYDNLQQCVSGIPVGDSVEFKGRVYTMKESRQVTVEFKGRVYTMKEPRQLTVTDAATQWQAPNICVDFNGVEYDSLIAFAKAATINSVNLRKKISREKDNNKKEFVYQGFEFVIVDDKSIKVTAAK